MKHKIFKTEFFDKKTKQQIEPIYIWHKAKNKMSAKADAKSFYTSFTNNLNRGADYINKLNKNFTVNVIEMQKRKPQNNPEPLSEKKKSIYTVTKKYKPYNKNGSTTFPQRNTSGVYKIFEDNKLVYIGMSTNNLYRTMYHHFNSWKDKTKQYRVTYNSQDNNIKVQIIYTNTGSQAESLEKILILKYKPRDNFNKYTQYILELEDKKIIKEIETAPLWGAKRGEDYVDPF